MEGWKVLNRSRQSCRSSNWYLATNRWSVHYPINVEVVPKVQGSKLFFFKTKKEAMEFAFSYEKVVPCIAKGVTKVKWIGCQAYAISSFWEKRSKTKDCSKKIAPKGTYLADSITCLE